jgi:hypothetical protein
MKRNVLIHSSDMWLALEKVTDRLLFSSGITAEVTAAAVASS